MKRRVIVMGLLAIAIFGMNIRLTNAREKTGEVFYTTPNGIELTEKEYKFLTTFYWDSYVDSMTEEQYEDFVNSDLLDRELITKSTDDGNMCSPKSTSHTTQYKNLKISAACSYNCTVSIVLTWLGNPTIRSYDVIGAFLSGPSLLSYVDATVMNNTTVYYFDNFKTEYSAYYNGIGNSVLLPSGTNLVVNQIFTTTTGGHIFGSYQHAMQNVSLATSKSYSFSLAGYGNVFSFYGNAYGKYDGMAGVDIAV